MSDEVVKSTHLHKLGYIICFRELLDPAQQLELLQGRNEDIRMVLEPMTPFTLIDFIGKRTAGKRQGMSFEAARLFCDMMAGIKFLHDNSWVHRDLKPGNVGVLMRDRYRAVLLDLGDAVQLPPGRKLDAAPGTNGTVNYLSPEREMTVYDHGEDVWSLGIIGYQLIYGYHPFMLARNPWRPGEAFEALRPTFQSHYSDAITRLRTHYEEFVKRGHRTQNPSFVHFGGLLIGMLRHSWSTKDSRIPRITINEALQHGSVKDVLGHDDEDRSKRYRAVA